MSFLVAVSRVVSAPRAGCFAALAAFPSWREFMPASFRPLRGPSRALAVGDRLLVRVAGVPLPALLQIVRLERDRVIVWRGGVPGVLVGEHAFYFDDADGGTRVRSEETWSGALAGIERIERRIQPLAARIGGEQIDGLTRWVKASTTT